MTSWQRTPVNPEMLGFAYNVDQRISEVPWFSETQIDYHKNYWHYTIKWNLKVWNILEESKGMLSAHEIFALWNEKRALNHCRYLLLFLLISCDAQKQIQEEFSQLLCNVLTAKVQSKWYRMKSSQNDCTWHSWIIWNTREKFARP